MICWISRRLADWRGYALVFYIHSRPKTLAARTLKCKVIGRSSGTPISACIEIIKGLLGVRSSGVEVCPQGSFSFPLACLSRAIVEWGINRLSILCVSDRCRAGSAKKGWIQLSSARFMNRDLFRQKPLEGFETPEPFSVVH